MADFEAVPIIDVHKDNFVHLWPAILLAVKTSSFIAIDTELSGIGNRRGINARCVEERYKAICMAAKSRSIISFGISCFQLRHDQRKSEKESWNYLVQTFNLTALCTDEYVVEPEALQFLVGHGFDFNKQYTQGIPYYKGNDRCNLLQDKPCIRQLFLEITRSGRSIILHNALIDLVFMHQCWYAELPTVLQTFLKDVNQIYCSGIYDTKYIAEFMARTPASYLEYIFRRIQRENDEVARTDKHVEVQFLQHGHLNCIEFKNLGISTTGAKTVSSSKVCMTYANHGWCPNGHACTLSHNVDCVLDMETSLVGKKRKRKCRKRQKKDKTKRVKIEIPETVEIDMMDLTENGIEDKFDSDELVIDLDRTDAAVDTSDKPTNGTNGEKHIENDESEDPIATNWKNEPEAPKNTKPVPETPKNTKPVPETPKNTKSVPEIDEKVQIEPEKTENVNEELEEGEIMSSPIKSVKNTVDNDTMTVRLGQKSSGHRAGCDAFMTGLVMAVFLSRYSTKCEGMNSEDCVRIDEAINKIYLSGKDVPLIIQKSEFAKHSKNYLDKVQRLNGV
uniref:Target of EGR1 protein 1 n=1 Tax=Strigamia maritima TaxID=126957 RepID=T1J7G0_STRMM